MATPMKRFTISIPPEMEEELDKLKQKSYYDHSRTTMIRDLIARGLENCKDTESDKNGGEKQR